MAVRPGAFRCLLAASAVLLLGASSCLLSFDHYAEGDPCGAGRDAGIRLSRAPDPVLRGCDAGAESVASKSDLEASAGAAGAEADP